MLDMQSEHKEVVDGLKAKIEKGNHDYKSKMMNFQKYADIEIQIRDQIEKQQEGKVNKLLDELKQVKTILKSPMLYFKFRDKTFTEINKIKVQGHPMLDNEKVGATRGQSINYKPKSEMRRRSTKTKRRYKKRIGMKQDCMSMFKNNLNANDSDVIQSPTASSLLSNQRLRMLRPTSAALPGSCFTKTRYQEDIKRDLELMEQDYSLNDALNKEIISFTSKNPGDKTVTTNMTSIEQKNLPSRQNTAFSMTLKSGHRRKSKSSIYVNNISSETGTVAKIHELNELDEEHIQPNIENHFVRDSSLINFKNK